ncbi:MAG TPA: hypothetical protein PK867_24210, partial [Pirellulales bacterium]|nr:hypothetical protein [Pirellulales bacterium]
LRDKKPGSAPDTGSPSNDAGKPGHPANAKEEAPVPVEERIVYRLFRFFDFNVEPGKTYCYRVKLVALNPNYELPARLLARPTSADELFLEAKWSAPTPSVAVVAGTRLLAGGITFGEDATATPDPTVRILVRFFDFATSRRVNTLFEATRGAVLNEAGVHLEAADTGPKNKKRPGKPDKKKPVETPTIDVRTDAMVVDFFGGDDLAGKTGGKVPSHVLVVDPLGGFKTLVEADDAQTFVADLPAAQSAGGPAQPAAEQARK